MPRHYFPTPDDRYILEEEGDVTEINFVMSGEWAIAFNTYVVSEENPEDEIGEDVVPKDMIKQGHYIAKRMMGNGYFGDYYVLASKRS